jgi:hypothetical protein
MNDRLSTYMAHWAFITGCDHWHCLKMALDDLWCEGLLPRQR